MKYALDKAKVEVGIGGLDFSFNEDQKGKYPPFWNPHLYVITTTRNKKLLKKKLAKQLPKTVATPRPIKITPFQNTRRRRSYALKTYFVVGLATTRRRSVETGSGNAETPAETNSELKSG